MSARYLLPCTCGKEHEVELSQAGIRLACSCGKELAVPTRRGMAQLRPAAAPPVASRRPGEGWTPQKGIAFLGAVISLAALALAVYLLARPPADPLADLIRSMQPTDSLEVWQHLRRGVESGNTEVIDNYLKRRETHRLLLAAAAFLGVAGLAVLATGLALMRKQRR